MGLLVGLDVGLLVGLEVGLLVGLDVRLPVGSGLGWRLDYVLVPMSDLTLAIQ